MVPKLKTLKRSVRDGNAGYLLGDLTRKNITKIRSPCPKIITWVRSGVTFSKWIRLNLTHEVRMRCAAVTKTKHNQQQPQQEKKKKEKENIQCKVWRVYRTVSNSVWSAPWLLPIIPLTTLIAPHRLEQL